MANQGSKPERRRVEAVTEEFIEKDLVSDGVEEQVLEHLDKGNPRRALGIILEHRDD
jgi:hypothetical protein